MRHFPLTYVAFLKILIWGKLFRKEKKMDLFLKIFKKNQILKIRDSSFVALLILRHFI